MSPIYMDPNELRSEFAAAISLIYQKEVPLYGDLLRIVGTVNKNAVLDDTEVDETTNARLEVERHGAIRLGTPYELQTVKRIFNILGMRSVDYYDLSVAGLPMHATSFRPTQATDLAHNPFRVFTTLLRPDLIRSDQVREKASRLLNQRNIFTPCLLQILDVAESQDGFLTDQQASVFIPEALKSFTWQPEAAATHQDYEFLLNEHPIVADICCFKTAHINHLTPRTLNIDSAQDAMRVAGMKVKASIEGPPDRMCPILLRQTSFLALEEKIQFRLDEVGSQPCLDVVQGSHKARFGEIEQRGAALTVKGRELYDKLLETSMTAANLVPESQYDETSVQVFKQFPDSWKALRQQGLVYFSYRCIRQPTANLDQVYKESELLEKCIEDGYVVATPLTFEDFLPFSAAGIFQSNLQQSKKSQPIISASPDLEGFQNALGGMPMMSHDCYKSVQTESLLKVARQLGMSCEAVLGCV